jgi:hypothetical protein
MAASGDTRDEAEALEVELLAVAQVAGDLLERPLSFGGSPAQLVLAQPEELRLDLIGRLMQGLDEPVMVGGIHGLCRVSVIVVGRRW